MKTNYTAGPGLNRIDLDELARHGKDIPQDTDFLFTFGGAEFIIQYRLENAGRIGHPFIDLIVGPGDPEITLDVVDEEGEPATVRFKSKRSKVVQLLIGQKTVENPEYE